MIVDTLVEGLLDEAVARRLLRHCGHTPGDSFGRAGWSFLRTKVTGFNVRAAYGNPILMLVDFMDTRLPCPSAVIAEWIPERSPRLLLRVVVNEVESWLLADGESLAQWLGISAALLPAAPENLPDPKQALVNLARRSRRRAILSSLVPTPGISTVVGPDYVGKMQEFIDNHWNPDRARLVAPSLDRCLNRLTDLASTG